MWWVIGSVLVVIWLLTALYHFCKDLRRTIVFLGSSLGIGATIVAAILAVLGLQESTKQHRISIEQSRKQASFNYLQVWRKIPQSQMRNIVELVRNNPPQETQKVFEKNSDYEETVRSTLVFFEQIGLAIKYSYADEETLCPLLQQPATRYYTAFEPWMEWYKNFRGLPHFFDNYEWLHERWKNGCPAVGSAD